MQVFLTREKLGRVTKTGNTTVQLSNSMLTLGAKQYSSGSIICDLSLSGAGGLDTGSVQGTTLYYIYVVLDTTPKLIASLSNQKPTGFTVCKKVGALFTTPSGNIRDHYNLNEQDPNEIKSFMTTGGGGGSPAIDTIGGRNIFQTPITDSGVGNYTVDYIADYFSERPSVIVSTRGDRFHGITTQGTLTNFNIRIDNTAGSSTDDDFTIHINPHGNDRVSTIDWTDY